MDAWRMDADGRQGAWANGLSVPDGGVLPGRDCVPVFRHYVKDRPLAPLPKAIVFETGSYRSVRENSWPPADAIRKPLYLGDKGRLSFDPPLALETPFEEYVSDPASPVPYMEHPPTDLVSEFMFGDQRSAAARPDVLTYRSEPLERDITAAGPVWPRLQVSTTGTDSDFDVKLIDEYPD